VALSGYSKLFASIITSTIWLEDHPTRIVWFALLATCDSEGIVQGSIPGFASLARVTVGEMRHAVSRLSAPDPDSRTPDHEGRRIEACEGGWVILNYPKYREAAQAKEGSNAPAMRAYRKRKREEAFRDTPVTDEAFRAAPVTDVTPSACSEPDCVLMALEGGSHCRVHVDR
jgi:hypothetical protein